MTIEHVVIQDPDAGEVWCWDDGEMQVSASRYGVVFGNDTQEERVLVKSSMLLSHIRHNREFRCACHWCEAYRKHRELAGGGR